jgi:predicted transcriptional regulator
MTTEIEVHPAQAKILVKLLFREKAAFTELLRGSRLTSDHFSFHLNKLLELGLIDKTADNKYQLTSKGKEFANRFDTDRKKVERQAKIGAVVVCMRKKGKTTEYLLQQRLKQPYFGFYGFISGKISWGETILETAARELKEETGLSAKLKLVGIEHKMDYSKDQNLLEDKFFFIVKGQSVKGNLIKRFKGGKNIWITRKKIISLDNLFKDIEKIISIVNKDKLTFVENKFIEEIY